MLPARSVMYGKTIRMGGYMPAPRVNTVYRYNTVEKVQNVTKYNDVEHTQYVRHINRIVYVTRVQPVTLHQCRHAHSRPPGILGQERVPAQDQNAPGAYYRDKQSHSDELPAWTHARRLMATWSDVLSGYAGASRNLNIGKLVAPALGKEQQHGNDLVSSVMQFLTPDMVARIARTPRHQPGRRAEGG